MKTVKGRYITKWRINENNALVSLESEGGTNLRVYVEEGMLNPSRLLCWRNSEQHTKMFLDSHGNIFLRFVNDNDEEFIDFIEHFTPLKFVKWDSYGTKANAIFVELNSLKVGKFNDLEWEADYDEKEDEQ